MDETARNAFPALQRVGEGFAVAEGEEDVDVIGHDGVAPEFIALAVEVMEAVGDDSVSLRPTISASLRFLPAF